MSLEKSSKPETPALEQTPRLEQTRRLEQTPTLEQQRLELRRQLAQQREAIAFQLTPNRPLRVGQEQGSYPRSLTMRLLSNNPAPALKLAFGVATWLLGARYSGLLREGLQFLQQLRAGVALR